MYIIFEKKCKNRYSLKNVIIVITNKIIENKILSFVQIREIFD